MGTWLFEGALSFTIFLVLIPVFITPFLHTVYSKYRFAAPGPIMLAGAAALYASSLVAFTNFPLPETPEGFCDERSTINYWQLTPGNSLGPVFDQLSDVGLVTTLTGTTFLQIAFNVVFFVPLGVLIAYRTKHGVLFAAALGLGVSLLIELTQGTGIWGIYPCPYRLADVDDLIANTAGAIIGWVVGWLLRQVWPFHEPAPKDDLAAPSIKRRVAAVVVDGLTLVAIVVITQVLAAVAFYESGVSVQSVKPWLQTIPFVVAIGLLVVIPALRSDRATPGQWAVLLGLAKADSTPLAPASQWSPLVRFTIRWLPFLIVGYPWLVFIGVIEGGTVAWRSDRRSLSSVLSRSHTVTYDQLNDVANQEKHSDGAKPRDVGPS